MSNMIPYETLHETVLRDVIEVAQGVKDSDEVKALTNFKNGSYAGRSIAARSQALTFVFPILADSSLSAKTDMKIAKAQERKCITMLQMLISAANISTSKDGLEYLKQFHSNLDTSGPSLGVDDLISALDSVVDEAVMAKQISSSEQENYIQIREEVRTQLNSVLNGAEFYIEHTDLNNYVCSNYNGQTNIFLAEAKDNGKSGPDDNWYRALRSQFKKFKKDVNDTMSNVNVTVNTNSNGGGSRRPNYSDTSYEEKEALVRQSYNSDINAIRNRVISTDIKKANELEPTLMAINYVVEDKDTSYPVYMTMVIGVKCKIYIVDPQDIIDRLTIKNTNKNLVLGLVKASTREISFLKDFLFAIDVAKIDALSQSRLGSSNKLWKVLERRNLKRNILKGLMLKNDATPITTLLVSQETVEIMKKSSYVDLEQPRVIIPLMNAYSFMCFVIADESLEVCKFMYDSGEDMYENYTFDALEKESSNAEKQLMNLLVKNNR